MYIRTQYISGTNLYTLTRILYRFIGNFIFFYENRNIYKVTEEARKG